MAKVIEGTSKFQFKKSLNFDPINLLKGLHSYCEKIFHFCAADRLDSDQLHKSVVNDTSMVFIIKIQKGGKDICIM